jgi:hypothetical protein
MPTPMQMEKLAADQARARYSHDPAPDAPAPDSWWESVLSDPRAAGKPWLPISQRRLSEIPRHLFRIDCLRCQRAVEIQKADAIKLFGPHAVYKDMALRLLGDTCRYRTGRLEEDGCWPDWTQ